MTLFWFRYLAAFRFSRLRNPNLHHAQLDSVRAGAGPEVGPAAGDRLCHIKKYLCTECDPGLTSESGWRKPPSTRRLGLQVPAAARASGLRRPSCLGRRDKAGRPPESEGRLETNWKFESGPTRTLLREFYDGGPAPAHRHGDRRRRVEPPGRSSGSSSAQHRQDHSPGRA